QSYELPEEAQIEVDLSFKEPVFTPEEIENSSGMRTYMLTAQAEGEEIQLPETGSSEALGDDKTPVRNPARQEDALETESSAQTESSEEQELIDEDLGAEISYLAEPTKGETVLEPEEGITGVSYRSGEIATLALALTTETQTGEFWIRLHSTDQITSGGTYMIVSAEGNYALRGNSSTNYAAVTIQSVKANENYYTISDSDNALLRWTISVSGESYTIRNQSSSLYLRLSNSTFISSTSDTATISYIPTEKVFRIANGSRYLRNAGTGAFTRTSSSDGSYNSNAVYYYTRDMLIFKLSDVTSLEVPADVTEENSGSGTGGTAPEKPDYPDFVTPSGSKSGETALVKEQDGTVISVKGEYYSDPATSNIEKEYREESFADNERNDGKVLTDKSVIYGADDYNAFESYAPNTFSVTLSTIGQEYKVPYQEIVRSPIDVVFVLDVSGSMKDRVEPNNDNNTDSRAQAMVKAANAAIDKIMNDHQANRVGLVIFSGGAWELLPLGRYKATDAQYLKCEVKSKVTHSPTNVAIDRHNVLGGDTLMDADDQSLANVGSNAVQGIGTYTQAGIAMGREVFKKIGSDTTYTKRVGFGEYERDYTVARQPVFILLSDGEPTYSTNIYMDPLNGPHYGDGNGGTDNAKGIHGYNTVLTANYCKRMVSIQYQKPALFFTVGMGICTPEQGDGPNISTSNTGDNYKRAVLNPTPEVIASLTSSKNAANTVTQFKNLLNGSFTSHAIKLRSQWPEPWTGIPHLYVPALQGNPYAGNYSYADDAYFGEITSEELQEIFTDIIESSVKTSPYGFILYKNSAIDLRDNIGAGMEVKGTPVLRYNGVNYRNPEVIVQGSVTTYVYHETNVDPYIPERENDLSQITVKVVRNDDGTQTVMMYVPDSVLPTYVPELIGLKYYYEMLPVRLIYQVGLTEAAEQQVLALEGTGRELSFYTNKWKSPEEYAVSTLVPSDYNPFYIDVDPDDGILPGHQEHQEVKAENTTGTLELAVDCHKYVDTQMDNRVRIVHTLGNNGKLVFRSDSTELPVEKRWEEVNADIMNPVTFELYKVTDQVSEEGIVTHTGVLVDSRVLSAQKEWKDSFTNLPIPDGTWYYVLTEKPLSGYQGFYDGQTVQFSVAEGTMLTGVKVDFDKAKDGPVIVTNAPAVKLPSTGGKGTYLYTMGGTLLVLTAALLLVYNSKPHRRRED
ncbi:MAG: VWA domain-containing protein, partial [Oscillospiraceae bacterium]|nr:VWA domain-containing protein [Oscillospiraceae bacterium]